MLFPHVLSPDTAMLCCPDTRVSFTYNRIQDQAARIQDLPVGPRAVQRPAQHGAGHEQEAKGQTGVPRKGPHRGESDGTREMGVGVDEVIFCLF